MCVSINHLWCRWWGHVGGSVRHKGLLTIVYDKLWSELECGGCLP